MSQLIASLHATITAETSGLDKGLKSAKTGLQDTAKAAGSTQGAVKGLTGSLLSMINPTDLAVAGVTALAIYLSKAEKAAAASAQVDAKLGAVLKSTGGAAGLSANQLDEMAASLSRMTGIDDEAVKSAEAVMLTFRNIGNDVFPQAMNAAADMSAVMGQDLQSSVVQLGKALNDPIGGVTALQRVGVQLSDTQKEQIRNFVALGDTASAQGVILQELQMEFGGAAKAINDAGDGSERLGVSMGNLSEVVGNMFLPATREAKNSLSDLIDQAADAIDKHNDLAIATQRNMEYFGLAGKSITLYGAEMAKVTQETELWQLRGEAMKGMLQGQKKSVEEVAQALEDEYRMQLDITTQAINGPISQAQDDYNAKIAEYRQQLAEAKKQKDKDTINENIAAETKAYQERAAAIVFNIQQEAILNSDMSDKGKADAIAALGKSMGVYDEATANAIVTSQYWTDQLAAGNITTDEYAAKLKYSADNAAGLASMQETAGASAGVLAGNLAPASAQMAQLGDKAKNTAGRLDDTTEAAEPAAEAVRGVGEAAHDAHGPLAGTTAELAKIAKFDGQGMTYTINIDVNGHVPNLAGLEGGSGGHTTYGDHNCFIAGTPVTMADGTTKPIEAIQPRDEILSYDTKAGKAIATRVALVFHHSLAEMTDTHYLNIDGLGITGAHKVYVNHKWIPACRVNIGDDFINASGQPVTVGKVVKVYKRVRTYNLETDHDTHNYFAGGVLVHNGKVAQEASGGPLGAGLTIVGEGPSGWSPTAEVIADGYVYSHAEAQKMKDAGLLDGATRHMISGPIGQGPNSPTPKSPTPTGGKGPRTPTNRGGMRAVSGGGGIIPGILGGAAEILGSVTTSGATQQQAAYIQQQVQMAAQQTGVLTQIHEDLKQILGKTATATDIAKSSYEGASKFS